MQAKIILASTSKFRFAQLSKLGIDFSVAKPLVDESALDNETAQETALRLAINKAKSIAEQSTNAVIIGSDQVAFCQNKQLGKPLSIEKAQLMLKQLSNQQIIFYTALAVYDTRSKQLFEHVDITTVKMRPLTEEMITQYLNKEPDAIYCAGAAKSEGLGMILIEQISSQDPNALIGLPMLKLIEFLVKANIKLL